MHFQFALKLNSFVCCFYLLWVGNQCDSLIVCAKLNICILRCAHKDTWIKDSLFQRCPTLSQSSSGCRRSGVGFCIFPQLFKPHRHVHCTFHKRKCFLQARKLGKKICTLYTRCQESSIVYPFLRDVLFQHKAYSSVPKRVTDRMADWQTN